MSPAVAVVVPTCGRPDLLRRCVGALEAQSLAADAYEIIVVDDTLARRGGFDESFRLPWREDSDLHFRLLEAGCRVVRAAQAIVVHPVRPAPWGVSLRQQRKVMFDALLFRKHRALYRERIRGAPRW